MRALVLCLLAVLGAFASPARRPLFSRGYPQIVGGRDAAPGEFPYQLSFQDTSHGYNFHFCGASIYDTVNAITAAHCVYGMNYDSPRDLVVVAGEVKLYANGEDAQAVPVVRIAINEGFSYSNLYNDVAILKVGTEFEFSDKVGPIALPRKGQKTTGSCTVTGWGALSPGGPSPDILQKVEVPVVADEDCRRSYGSSAIADSMICAGRGGKDACQGDSGGPMKCGNYLGGIVSWGHGCARPLYPGVYTEVSYFIDWIEEHLF